MTLQVGLVGLDGTVLASDRLLQQWESGVNAGESGYSLTMTSKFVAGNGLLCCYSGDSIAQLTAQNICAIDKPADLDHEGFRVSMVEVANRARQSILGTGSDG